LTIDGFRKTLYKARRERDETAAQFIIIIIIIIIIISKILFMSARRDVEVHAARFWFDAERQNTTGRR